jgi:uncharacterized protein (TIGR02246 family)
MANDEQAIRDLIDTWMRATADGDLPQILKLMAEDVVFLTPGQPPMRGREAFASGFKKALEQFRIESTSDIQEIQIVGDWGYCWNHLHIKMIPHGEGAPMRRSGYTLTLFTRKPEGAWVLFRDANLVMNERDGE